MNTKQKISLADLEGVTSYPPLKGLKKPVPLLVMEFFFKLF